MNLPMCDVCKKPVDRIECFDKIETAEKVYRVYCHGQVEETILSNKIMMQATSIFADSAFKVKKLSHYNQQIQPT